MRLVGIARKENARVVLAAVKTGDAASVDGVRRTRNGLAEGNADVVASLSVSRGGGERDRTGIVIDRRDSHLSAVDRSGERHAVKLSRIQMKFRAFSVSDKGIDALSGQQIDRLETRAAARGRGGNGGRRHIGDALHADSLPCAALAAADCAKMRPVEQIKHTVHGKRLRERAVHVAAEHGLPAVFCPEIQVCTGVDERTCTVGSGENTVDGRVIALLHLPAGALDEKVVPVAYQILQVRGARQRDLGRMGTEVRAAEAADDSLVLGLGRGKSVSAHQTISCTAVNWAGQCSSRRSAYSSAAQLNFALSSSAHSSAARP